MNRDVSHSVGKTGPTPRFEHVKGRHTAALCSRRAGYGHLRSGSLVPVSKQVICCELERLATYMRCSSRQLTEIQSNGAGRTEGPRQSAWHGAFLTFTAMLYCCEDVCTSPQGVPDAHGTESISGSRTQTKGKVVYTHRRHHCSIWVVRS